MFEFLRKESKNVDLKAIANGELINIEKVPDKVFASKMMGNGIGFCFDGNKLYSPCDGEVTMIAPTKHAIGICTKNKAEILIHCGLDTVNLNGKGLCVKVKVGQKIKVGEELLEVDLAVMNENKIILTTPMVITNSDDFEIKFLKK